MLSVQVEEVYKGNYWISLHRNDQLIHEDTVKSSSGADWLVFVWALHAQADGAESLRLGCEAYRQVEALRTGRP